MPNMYSQGLVIIACVSNVLNVTFYIVNRKMGSRFETIISSCFLINCQYFVGCYCVVRLRKVYIVGLHGFRGIADVFVVLILLVTLAYLTST